MREPVLERLRQGPVLCDGAMGTMLYARASASQMHGRCFDELTLTSPHLVQEIHNEYILAGAQMIETNTFGANQAKLSAYGLGDRVRELNRRAAKLAYEARDVAGQAVFVAGAVGPSGLLNLPTTSTHGASSARHAKGQTAHDEAIEAERRLAGLRALFREQIEGLIEGGADLIILETIPSLTELRQAALAAREAGALPVIAQITFSEDGQTLAGESPAEVALALAQLHVDGIGVNCSIGPAGTLDAITEMAEALRAAGVALDGDLFLSAQPNAGLPARVENRFLYTAPPTYFADYARQFVAAGVRLVGGCCGTTPAHIAAMRAALADTLPTTTAVATGARSTLAVSHPITRPAPEVVVVSDPPAVLLEDAPRTRLQAALDAGRFAVSVELDPPKGLNPRKILDGAAQLRAVGVEFINIADSPMARVRMSCLAMARLLHDELGMEPIVHMTTRDRNLMALQSDLLGAHALGIRNILALTGDPLHAGNYPNLTGVWDVDSVGLLRILRGLNEGRDAAGSPLGSPAQFFLGAALNLNMEDTLIDVERERQRGKLDALNTLTDLGAGEPGDGVEESHGRLTETELELQRLRQKLNAGAQFIMTQPIYDLDPLERFLARFGQPEAPIILGMIPLHSSKHAEYLHNEVPGITIPEAARARMRAAGEHGREEGIAMAYEVISAARKRGLIQGCYLVTSYGRYDLVSDLARELLEDETFPALHGKDKSV